MIVYLGDLIRDRISGVQGICTASSYDPTVSMRVMIGSTWFDAAQCEVVTTSAGRDEMRAQQLFREARELGTWRAIADSLVATRTEGYLRGVTEAQAKAQETAEKTCKSSGVIYEEVISLRRAVAETKDLRDQEYTLYVERLQQIVDANGKLVEDRDSAREALAGAVAAGVEAGILEERKRVQYRMTDAAIADQCHHCEDPRTLRDENDPCWWCGRISEAAALARGASLTTPPKPKFPPNRTIKEGRETVPSPEKEKK